VLEASTQAGGVEAVLPKTQVAFAGSGLNGGGGGDVSGRGYATSEKGVGGSSGAHAVGVTGSNVCCTDDEAPNLASHTLSVDVVTQAVNSRAFTGSTNTVGYDAMNVAIIDGVEAVLQADGSSDLSSMVREYMAVGREVAVKTKVA
jgi:hypothetical protein